jgi:hypothetical protein
MYVSKARVSAQMQHQSEAASKTEPSSRIFSILLFTSTVIGFTTSLGLVGIAKCYVCRMINTRHPQII